MSHASFMEKLLEGVEVEWRTLGEVGEVRMCKRILKNQTSSEGEIPFYKIGTFGKEPDAYIPQKLFEEYKAKYNYPKVGEILISASGTIGRTVIFDGKDAYFQDSNIVWIENNEREVLNKYLFHFYQIANWGIAEGGTIQRLYNDNLRKLQIPIPCPENLKKSLEIQTEIVRILDAFTAHTAELTARKKQYNYYRDQLLTFEEGKVEWKTLGEIGEFVRGNGLQKSDFAESGVGCIHYGQIYTYYGIFAYQTKSFVSPILAAKLRKAQKGDLIIATTSENIEDVCKPLVWLGDDEICVSGETYVFKHNQNSKYLAYYLQTPMFFEYKKQNRTGTKVIRVHGDKLVKFQIPIPPLTEQSRIVAILEKFDALTHSITEGLPREIELRQQQYAYYRDLLLSFKVAEVVSDDKCT